MRIVKCCIVLMIVTVMFASCTPAAPESTQSTTSALTQTHPPVEAPAIEEGTVSLFSMGMDYTMDKYLFESDFVQLEGNVLSQQKTAKATLVPAQITWDAADAAPVSSMMEMNVSGDVFGEITYDLYETSGQSVYTAQSEFTPPTEAGDYYLFAYIAWGQEDNYKRYQYYLPLVMTNPVERAEGIEIISLTPSGKDVDKFMENLGNFTLEYENDTCFNVMPAEVAQKYGFDVFKFDLSAANFLVYDGMLHPMGTWIGGNGVHNFAIADVNEDGYNELYFAYSSGSGMHRSNVAYFDTGTREIVDFNYTLAMNDAVLGAENGVLGIYKAENMDIESFIDIKFERGEQLATITNVDGNIMLTEL